MKIIPYSKDLNITNLQALPKGLKARYLEVIYSPDNSTLIAKQWKRILPTEGTFVDMEPQVRAFSKKADILSDPIVPYKQVEDRGSKEISKYDDEYLFLLKLIKVVTREGVPAQEIKDLSLANPFQTVDDVGNLAAQIWTLATQKYNIPREWLMKKLPEKKGNLKVSKKDYWSKAKCPLCGEFKSTDKTPKEREKQGWECNDCTEKRFEKHWNKKADLQEYSNEETKGINDFIIQHPKIMEVVIDAAQRATDEKSFTDWLQKALTDEGMEEGVRKAVKWEELGWAWFNVVKRETTEPTSTDVIDKLPTLDKSKKIDQLLEQLSVETDPQKKEQIKQNIERIKRAKLLKADLWPSQEAASEGTITQSPGQIAYNNNQEKDTSVSGPNPNDKISSTDEFSIYKDFVNDSFYHKGNRWSSVIKELKNLYPQITEEEIAKLKQDVKYQLEQSSIQLQSKKKSLNIDQVVQMLNKKEPKVTHVNLKEKTLDLQDGTTLTFDEAIKTALEMDKEGVFQGSEFSNTDWCVNPTLDSGPFSSPQDQGAGDQEQPFPNTNWVPADDENKDEQPYSNIASSLNKKAAEEFVSQVNVDGLYLDKLFGEEVSFEKPTSIRWSLEIEFREWGVKGAYIHIPDQEVVISYETDTISDANPDGGYEPRSRKVSLQNVKIEGADHASWDSVLTPQTLSFDDTSWVVDFGNYRTAALSKKELKKKANPKSRYWIAPDGQDFEVFSAGHGAWIIQNKPILKKYGINTSGTIDMISNRMYDQGWTRISDEPNGTGFQIQIRDIKNVPSYIDDFISQNFSEGDTILIGDRSRAVEITDPFPSIQKVISKTPVHASLKKADLSGQVINEILKGIESTGGVTYNFSKGNLSGSDNYAVSIFPYREKIVDGVDFDILEGYLIDNEELLSNPTNSFGAWSHDGKVYLDVVATVPNQQQALKLAQDNNQIAIWDLKNSQEITASNTENTVKAISKKELIAEEALLSQDQQDEVAAKWTPAMNIALENYAQALKNGHDSARALEYAVESVSNIGPIKLADLEMAISTYLVGLV